jgi:hypothetical protein
MRDEALKLALEALDNLLYWDNGKPEYDEAREAITAINQALAAPVQEPVADAFMVHLYNLGYKSGHHDTVEGQYIDLLGQDMDTYHSDFVSEWLEETCNTTPPAAQPAPVQQKPLFVGLIAQIPGLAEELKAMDVAQPAQKPVAWMTQARNFVNLTEFTEAQAKLYGWTPLYTTPPAAPKENT